jgi:hypothetical protein
MSFLVLESFKYSVALQLFQDRVNTLGVRIKGAIMVQKGAQRASQQLMNHFSGDVWSKVRDAGSDGLQFRSSRRGTS